MLHAQPLSAPSLTGVHDSIETFLRRDEIAGAVTAVITPDKVVHLQAQGFADLEAMTPMRTDHLFWIASMTKPVTAVAVMILVEEGKLSIDDPASKYIPELGRMKNADGSPAKTITVKHLLTHTAGLPEITHEETVASRRLQDIVTTYSAKPMSFEPGSKWAYSQTAINSLGRIVEVVSGQRFEDFLDERLFRPLGMRDTTFYPTADQLKRLARSYKLQEGKLVVADLFPFVGQDLTDRNRVPLANGGLFSTAADYARFAQMLLNEGILDGRRYLKPESVRQMASVHTGELQTGFIPGSAWGLGVGVVRKPAGVSAALSPGTFGHGGAYGTQAWIDPKKKVAYILLIQKADSGNSDASEIRRQFQDAAAKALVN